MIVRKGIIHNRFHRLTVGRLLVAVRLLIILLTTAIRLLVILLAAAIRLLVILLVAAIRLLAEILIIFHVISPLRAVILKTQTELLSKLLSIP